MTTPMLIPQDWIERYMQRTSASERGAIATMLRDWEKHTALEAERLRRIGNLKATKIASLSPNEAREYFSTAADVWRAYQAKKISMHQRDKALWDLARGIPVAVNTKVEKPKPTLDDLL